MTEERQPNTELREKARELFKCISCDGSGRVMAMWNSENPGGCPVCKGLGVRPMTMDELAAFAASIQKEARAEAFREAAENVRKWAEPMAGGIANMTALDIALALERAGDTQS